MSLLLKEIKRTNPNEGQILERAGFCTDSEIQSLTRVDLHELFPGAEKLKVRRDIFEKIQKQKPIDLLLKDMKEFIPHESLRGMYTLKKYEGASILHLIKSAALMDGGVLATYLYMLKDIKTQVNNVQTFLDAQIDLLEDINKSQADVQHNRASLSGTSTSAINGPMEPHYGQNIRPQDSKPGCSSYSPPFVPSFTKQTQGTVTYKMVVSGTTFDAHLQLLDKVKPKGQQWELVCDDQDYQIIIVFCPIISRVGTDVEAALREIKDNKPIILVLMHHLREPRSTNSIRMCVDNHNVVLGVDIFYHETVHGLLDCPQNNSAATLIQEKLMEYKIMTSTDTSGNARGMSARSHSPGNDRSSQCDSGRSSYRKWFGLSS